jgi:hypothetical protein
MSDSSSFTLSNMLSMGEDLKDERGNNHIEFKDHLHQDVHHSFSILSTMIKHGEAMLHFTVSTKKDDNLPLTLCLFTSF